MIEPLTASIVVTGVGMCVVEALETTPESGGITPKMRVCLLVPGNIAWDACDCGQFAQAFQRDYPTLSFPADASEQILGAGGGCNSRPIAYQVIASIVRCVPGMTGTPPQPPTCAKLLDAAYIQAADAYVLRTSIECCLEAMQTEQLIEKFVVGNVTYVGPEGNCAGVELIYRFELM
jgi:hypothetical protein